MGLFEQLDPFRHPDDEAKLAEFWAEVEATPEPEGTLEEILDRNNREALIEAGIAPNDETEVKQLREVWDQAQAEAERSNEELMAELGDVRYKWVPAPDSALKQIRRLQAALQVCETALHRIGLMTEDGLTPLLHAAQQASGAWASPDWTPETPIWDDLPGWVFDENGFGPARETA